MPYKNIIPETKIYDKKLSYKTMRHYAWLIKNKCLIKNCENCGSDKINIHHKNKDIWDNRLNNLQILCPKCHFKADFPNGRESGFKGKHLTEKHKQHLRELRLGKKLSPEMRKKLSECSPKFWLGKHRSEKTKRKISETRKKRFLEGKIKGWNKGLTKETDERIKLISENCKNNCQIYNINKMRRHYMDNQKFADKGEVD